MQLLCNIQKKIARLVMFGVTAVAQALGGGNIQKKIASWFNDSACHEIEEPLQHSKENSKLRVETNDLTPFSP